MCPKDGYASVRRKDIVRKILRDQRNEKYLNRLDKRIENRRKRALLIPNAKKAHNFCVEISIQDVMPCKSFNKCLKSKRLEYKRNPYCYKP